MSFDKAAIILFLMILPLSIIFLLYFAYVENEKINNYVDPVPTRTQLYLKCVNDGIKEYDCYAKIFKRGF